jgi:adenosine kinase
MGPAGVRIEASDQEPIEVPAVPGVQALEPTGVGDAFRSGFLAALEWQLSHERAAQVGCVLAAYVVEQVGTQEYSFTHDQFVDRFAAAYGEEAAVDVRPHLS